MNWLNKGRWVSRYRMSRDPASRDLENIDSISEHFADATLVFFPFRFRSDQIVSPFGIHIEKILPRL